MKGLKTPIVQVKRTLEDVMTNVFYIRRHVFNELYLENKYIFETLEVSTVTKHYQFNVYNVTNITQLQFATSNKNR